MQHLCQTQVSCPGLKNVSEKPSETFIVSVRHTSMLLRFAMDGQNHRTQCCNHNRAVYTRENKQRVRQSAAYASRELSHLYEHGLYKKLVRAANVLFVPFIRAVRSSSSSFPRINGPNVSSFCWGLREPIRKEAYKSWYLTAHSRACHERSLETSLFSMRNMLGKVF